MNYAQLVAQLTTLAVQSDVADVDFDAMLPEAINAGELQCYRDVDFMVTREYEDSNFGPTAPANAILGAPTDMLILRYLYYFTPFPLTPSTGGTRVQLRRREESYLNDYWPNRSTTGTPLYFAILSDGQFLIAPTPDAQYAVQLAKTVRPAPISSTNTTTWLATWCPDLLTYACMEYICGFQQNFGAQSDNPQMALSWRGKYQAALGPVRNEESRKKSQGFFDRSPTPPASVTPLTGG